MILVFAFAFSVIIAFGVTFLMTTEHEEDIL